jgi:heme exporter protein D
MNMPGLADWWAMDGHGLYVWGSYGMVAVALAWEAWLLVQRRRQALDEIALVRLYGHGDDGATAATTRKD